jgi:hypothetical protein
VVRAIFLTRENRELLARALGLDYALLDKELAEATLIPCCKCIILRVWINVGETKSIFLEYGSLPLHLQTPFERVRIVLRSICLRYPS